MCLYVCVYVCVCVCLCVCVYTCVWCMCVCAHVDVGNERVYSCMILYIIPVHILYECVCGCAQNIFLCTILYVYTLMHVLALRVGNCICVH